MLRFEYKRYKTSIIMDADRAREDGQWQLAAGLYRIALNRNPKNPPIWIQYGHALKESGNRAGAETAYRTALSYDPNNADAHLQLGHVLKLQGKIAEAIVAYHRALEIDHAITDAGDELAELRRIEATASLDRATIKQVVRNGKTNATAVLIKADRHKVSIITRADRARDLRQWELAAGLYRRALDRNPRRPEIWVQYGHALKESGRVRDAETAYRTAIAQNPLVADFHLQLGHLSKLERKREDAEAAYLRAITIEPSKSEAFSGLAELGWPQSHLLELRNVVGASLAHPDAARKFETASVAPPPGVPSRASSPLTGGTENAAAERAEHDIQTIRESGLLDEAYYRVTTPALPVGIDAIRHFVECGAKEGRMPNRMFDPEFYLRLNPDVAHSGDNPLVHFICHGASEGRRPHRFFDPAFYLATYPDVAHAGLNPLWHFLYNGQKEGREATAKVTDSKILCVKPPARRDEVALFAAHSPHGRLQPHVQHYLDSLRRQNIAVVLIISGEMRSTDLDANCRDRLDGIFIRQAQGYDFAAWAHILLLYPQLFDAKILYLLNDSIIGPTNDVAFAQVLRKVRESSADMIALTESLQQGWHLQSYFLALKHQALTSATFRKFISDVVPFNDKNHVVREFEIPLASTLRAAGLHCEAIFQVRDLANPTLRHWKDLLQSGFPFLKVQAIRDVIAEVDVSDWRELLAAQGYDISLAERTLAESRACSLIQKYSSFSWIRDATSRLTAPQDPNSLFDTTWYLQEHAEVATSGLSPLDHYRSLGAARGYDPHPLFDTSYYLERNPDVAASGINPLEHFLSIGAAEDRFPHPLFDTAYYRSVEQACDEAHLQMNPLEHFLRFGASGGWNPNPMFNTRYYLDQNPDVTKAGINPLVHFLLAGAAEGRDPHPLFDTSYYLEQYSDVARSGMNPLEHFLKVGAPEIRRPHPQFYDFYYLYLEKFQDMAEVWTSPLAHLSHFKASAGDRPHPLFDASYYLKHNPDVARAGIDPFEHFLLAGAAEGRNPHSLFDTAYYRTGHPEVAAEVNPLEHFLRTGAAAGYSPHPLFDTLRVVNQYIGAGLERQPSPKRRRIQVHRARAAGDVLLLTPVLKALRQKHPEDEILVSTVFPELLLDNPHIDGAIKSPIPLPGFDETLIFEYETRPDEHIVDAYARIACVSVPDVTPEIYLRHDERIAATELLASAGVHWYDRFCAMAVTANYALDVRNWPVDRFKAVAEELEREGVRVVILGQRREPLIDFGVDLRGNTSLRMAAAIIEKCELMVTVDSGLMHIGYATRRPVISLFGSTDPEKRVPNWALSSALHGDIICRGCHHRQRPIPVRSGPLCPWETVLCMDQISPDMVMSQARVELARTRNPTVSIVIPHYLKYALLSCCLTSIFRYGARCSFEVIVVANGSPYENIRQLEAWRPNVRIVTLQPNQGFAKACNAGANTARGRYVVFLNDDTTVTPGWLDAMISFVESDPKVGITGPKLLYPGNDCIQHCGTVFNEQGLGEHIYRLLPSNFVSADRPRYYRALTGACLLIERELFLTLGQFETSYHGTGGCEDTDLCFKVLEHGKMVAYCPYSVIYHHEGMTRGRRDEHHPEEIYNRSILRQRWSRYLTSDISDYRLLTMIEAGEGKTWRWLRDVPAEIVARYYPLDHGSVWRPPFKVQIGSGARLEPGYLHLDSVPSARNVDIIHDISHKLPFPDETVAEILVDNVLERVPRSALPGVLQELYRVSIVGGELRIRSPDFRDIVQSYLELASGPVAADDMSTRRANVRLSDDANELRVHSSCRDGNALRALVIAAGFSSPSLRDSDWPGSRGEIEIVAVRS